MRKYVYDGFAGLGGASEAFLQAGDFVYRADNNPLLKDVPNMTIEHVRDSPKLNWDIMLFGPPCTEFSNGYNGPRAESFRSGKIHWPDLSLVKDAIEMIEEQEPDYWVIENVVGSIKYLKPYLGEPTQIVGPYVLWHNLPGIISAEVGTKAMKDVWSSDPLRANKKAKWPLALSQAIRDLTHQPRLGDFHVPSN